MNVRKALAILEFTDIDLEELENLSKEELISLVQDERERWILYLEELESAHLEETQKLAQEFQELLLKQREKFSQLSEQLADCANKQQTWSDAVRMLEDFCSTYQKRSGQTWRRR